MRGITSIAALMAAVFISDGAQATTVLDRDIARAEGPRHYIIVQPDGVPAQKRPLVILLHGHGGSAAMMVGLKAFAGLKMDEWTRLAEREHVVLLAPDGAIASDGKQAWNDCRADATKNTATDDVGYIAALIDVAVAQFGADPERVYVYGSSHGGAMAFRLAIELAPRLAAAPRRPAPCRSI
jgi:polyhydroxybutyrate depolymerase